MLCIAILAALAPALISAATIPQPNKPIRLTVSWSDDDIDLYGYDVNAGTGTLWLGKPVSGGPCATADTKCIQEGRITGQTGFVRHNDNSLTLYTNASPAQELTLKQGTIREFAYNEPRSVPVDAESAYIDPAVDSTPFTLMPPGMGQKSGAVVASNSSLVFGACNRATALEDFWVLRAYRLSSEPKGCSTVDLMWSEYEGVKPAQFI